VGLQPHDRKQEENRGFSPGPFSPFRPKEEHVISTETTDGTSVRRAVERPLYFAFAAAVASLVVIPEGDVLLFSSVLPMLCFYRHPERSVAPAFPSRKKEK
jgi:hypothetical protein